MALFLPGRKSFFHFSPSLSTSKFRRSTSESEAYFLLVYLTCVFSSFARSVLRLRENAESERVFFLSAFGVGKRGECTEDFFSLLEEREEEKKRPSE